MHLYLFYPEVLQIGCQKFELWKTSSSHIVTLHYRPRLTQVWSTKTHRHIMIERDST